MKILFVNYHHLDGNSGIHIFNLANELTRLGVECTVCVPFHKEATGAIGSALFQTVELADFQQGRIAADFDLIHAWTPREIVRKIVVQLLAMRPVPYIVHLEDNEEYIIESVSRVPAAWLSFIPDILMPLTLPRAASHPRHYKKFLANATGHTVIIEALGKFCPPAIPRHVIWAGYQVDMDWGRPPEMGYRQLLGLTNDEFVIVYTGNAHFASRQEIADLYLAIDKVNQRNIPVKLIRTGINYAPLPGNANALVEKGYCIELGRLPRNKLPSLLSIADILVQPGKPGPFNDYRFPSKLPEYLASGKPVILPKTNLGLHLKNNEECLLLDQGDVPDLASKIELLLLNKELRNRIGAGGQAFAEQNLKWSRIATRLKSFYKMMLRDTEV